MLGLETSGAGGFLSVDAVRSELARIGQDHLLTFFKDLAPGQQASLLRQITSMDLASIPGLVEKYVKNKPKVVAAGDLEPVLYYPADADSTSGRGRWDRSEYRRKGLELIAAGKVAAFTVAGGQGSRLGFDGPKGCYPGGAVTGRPLFGCLADWILAARERYCGGRPLIPWYIMTSPQNHAATLEFFKANDYFGLGESEVFFFPQGVMPSFDMATGHILLNDRHEVSLNPDGHGGSLKALYSSGAIESMQRRGIEHISYTQIDNPLVRVIDPVFIGLHAFAPDSSGEMSSKMVAKAHAHEKVGVLCRSDGKTVVIEYSDMPRDLQEAVNPGGGLKFSAGSIAIHMIGVDFVRCLNQGSAGFSLPYHRAEKKVPFIDLSTGRRVEPDVPNAVKLETFVFDALPLAKSSIVLETERIEEFAPIKNATGADSVETCREIQTRRAGRWLSSAGTRLPYAPDGSLNCVLEINPRRAMDAEELRGTDVPGAVAPGARLAL
jgi:UDP-N-acetylglucosamine/UDP-N-acetylgalactosamine diphosphorylase